MNQHFGGRGRVKFMIGEETEMHALFFVYLISLFNAFFVKMMLLLSKFSNGCSRWKILQMRMAKRNSSAAFNQNFILRLASFFNLHQIHQSALIDEFHQIFD